MLSVMQFSALDHVILSVTGFDRSLRFYAAAPLSRTWDQRTAYLRDPDGHLIELAQQLDKPA